MSGLIVRIPRDGAASVLALIQSHIAGSPPSVHGLGSMSTETAADYGKLAVANSWTALQTITGTAPSTASGATTVQIGGGTIDAGAKLIVRSTAVDAIDCKGSITVATSLIVGANKVVGAQGAAIADADAGSGTATSGGWGFVSEAEFNAFITAFNALKDSHNTLKGSIQTHGLIAT